MKTRMFAVIAIVFISGSVTSGQANFVESFDNLGSFVPGQLGPAVLVSQGWIFRNQSSPPGDYTWRGGPYTFNPCGYSTFAPHSGAGYLGADGRSISSGGGFVSNWAILPTLPGQQAGDQITLWAQRVSVASTATIIEIRYSPGGGTGTGSGNNDIGDFTIQLLSIAPPPSSGWGRFSATVPGNGRIAIRYLTTSFVSRCSQVIGIDSLSVGPTPVACPEYPPLPQPGQSVTWTAMGSPYRACADVQIPQGATVNVEPGVVVNIDTGRSIVVEGRLNAAGTVGSPVTFSGPDQSAKIKSFGTVDLRFATVNCRLEPQEGGTIILADATLQMDQAAALTVIGLPTYLWKNPGFIRLDRCTVFGDGVAGWDFLTGPCTVSLRDVSFTNCEATLGGYALVDNVTSTDSPGYGLSVGGLAGVYVNHVTVTGAAGPALALGDGSVLGPNNVIQGNRYPVTTSGLSRDSTIPLTGNTNNQLLVSTIQPGSFWANLGLPWLFTQDSGFGSAPFTIDPGATVLMGPNAAMARSDTRIRALGLPQAPIRFIRANPAQPWNTVDCGVCRHGPRLDWCIVEGADNGVIADASIFYLTNSIVRNNNAGGVVANYGVFHIRGTQFTGNATALSATSTGSLVLNEANRPNAFEGNGAAFSVDVTEAIHAENNWWGDSSGPQAPGFPAGMGQPIGGPGAVYFQPFLTQRPDFANPGPVVRMAHEPYTPWWPYAGLLEPGSKYILRWTVQDNDPIVGQSILFSPEGNLESQFQVIASGLPGSARSFELTVPNIGFAATGLPSFIRVVAVAADGLAGFDEFPVTIPSQRNAPALALATDLSGQMFLAGQDLPPIAWTSNGPLGGTPHFFLLLDADEQRVDLGGGFVSPWSLTDGAFVSTDLARLGVQVQGTYNDFYWVFGGYFSIRPDLRIGDNPPVVQITAPANGQMFPGGSAVPIAWTASDDEGLRSFNIQASFDSGRTWHVIARDLPGQATSFNWFLPASQGIADVRVRVIARDIRLQNSSSTSGVFSFTAGGGDVPGDINGDGLVNAEDASLFVAVLLGSDTDPAHVGRADLNRDNVPDGDDAQAFVNAIVH